MPEPDRIERIEGRNGSLIEVRAHNSSASSTVVLSQGFWPGEVLWHHVVDDLGRDHRVVTWSYAGPATDDEGETPDFQLLYAGAADLAAVQRTAGISKAMHLGFGFGTYVVAEHCRQQTSACSGLVLLPASPPRLSDMRGAPAAVGLLARALGELSSVGPGVARLARKANLEHLILPLGLRLGCLGPTCDEDHFRSYLRSLVGQSARSLVAPQGGTVPRSLDDAMAGLVVPTLVFGASRDLVCPEQVMRRVHEIIPGSIYEELKGASHACLLELGPVIAARVRRFIQATSQ